MKQITRRLYTKPVMLGLAFLVGAALVAGLFVTTKSKAAMFTYIQAGNDEFETTGNGETYHNFQASPVPAGFFGTGSNQYAGLVPLVGVPLNPAVSDTDTIIHRNSDVITPGSTTITMTALNLQGINPITVTYSDNHTESWTVKVNLSSLKTSGGSMSFNAAGSAFDSSLSVYPKFTFTRVSDGVQKCWIRAVQVVWHPPLRQRRSVAAVPTAGPRNRRLQSVVPLRVTFKRCRSPKQQIV